MDASVLGTHINSVYDTTPSSHPKKNLSLILWDLVSFEEDQTHFIPNGSRKELLFGSGVP